MRDDGVGQIIRITERPKSRREVLATASGYGQTRVTLAAGVLGTPDGQAVIEAASDRQTLAYQRRRNRPRPTAGA